MRANLHPGILGGQLSMMSTVELRLRQATAVDLEYVNAVVESAVMSWNLPERVKRLSLPSYRYHGADLDHLTLVVAENGADDIVGVAAWEAADPKDAPLGARALLLHGIYVAPDLHRRGVGSQLLSAAAQAARDGGFHGLLVKASPEAQGFFAARGLQHLPVQDARRDYPHRFWMSQKPSSSIESKERHGQ